MSKSILILLIFILINIIGFNINVQIRYKIFDPNGQHAEMATEQYITWFKSAVKKILTL